MINLDDIKGRSALNLLEKYSGENNYIKKMQNDYLKNNKLILTEIQTKYIIENHNKEPIKINRVIRISPFFGEELQRQENLPFVPEKIMVDVILADTDKTYHVMGKLKRNQTEFKMYWLPKTQVVDDPYFEEVEIDVDFNPYNFILSKTDKKLYQHQETGIKFLLTRNGCILADDMGLGKSIQSIIAALESGAKKILIVCPSSVKVNWKREINVFCDDVAIVNSKNWQTAQFTIINFDILKNFHTLTDEKDTESDKIIHRELANANFDLLIVDEAHNLKNKKSKRGEIIADLAVNYGINKTWLLTGTPVANRPMDFFNLLKIIKSPIAENWHYFANRYCDAKKFYKTLKNGTKKQIWLTDGASNLEELAARTKNSILRRLKTEVLDMPDKIVSPIYHELSDSGWKEYEELWDAYLEKRRKEKKKGTIQRDLVELGLLRKFIAMQAIPETIEMAENAIEMGQKVIIFTTFTDELNELKNHFGKLCVTHNGPMKERDKQNSVDSFQNNPNIKVFIGNIKSAGVGITLTEGTLVIFNSFDWVTGNNEQAEDRAFRIGQKKNVIVYYQLFEGTVSIRMWETLKRKKDIISVIMGETNKTEEEITEILMDEILNYI